MYRHCRAHSQRAAEEVALENPPPAAKPDMRSSRLSWHQGQQMPCAARSGGPCTWLTTGTAMPSPWLLNPFDNPSAPWDRIILPVNCRDNDLSKTEVTRLELNNDPTHTYTDKVTHPSSAKLEESDIQGRRDFPERNSQVLMNSNVCKTLWARIE